MLDLTEGRPFRALLIFALPVIRGNLFQLFYTLADSVIVGRTLGALPPDPGLDPYAGGYLSAGL